MKARTLLGEAILAKGKDVDRWFCERAQKSPMPFYCSVDLRDSGGKIAPVDNNLYPAGFNNICPDDLSSAHKILQRNLQHFVKRCHKMEKVKKVVILPENHTSNHFYIENLEFLIQIFEDAGLETRLGWYAPDEDCKDSAIELKSASGRTLTAHRICIEAGLLYAGDFQPDLVILNNDFSGGYPEGLDPVKQPIVPNHGLGWHTRQKITHFQHYNRIVLDFADYLAVEPGLMTIDTRLVTPVDFLSGEGIDKAAETVDQLLADVRKSYQRLGLPQEPYAIVKNNAGTYGMGIMAVTSGEDLRSMNRRSKNKMSMGKNRSKIASVVIQEGMETAVIVDKLPSEPVIYLMGIDLIGGFLRANTEKNNKENLNAKGMVFRKLCMSDIDRVLGGQGSEALSTAHQERYHPDRQLEVVYGSIARLSALATAHEIQDFCGPKAC